MNGNDFFDSMPPYEFILLIMGVVFFLVLLFLLVWGIMHKRSISTLLPFFLAPIIMVAYPTIKSVTIGNVVINTTNTVTEFTKIVDNNPGDTVAVANLKKATTELKTTKGVEQNGQALLAITNAQIAMGSYDSASLYLNKAEKVAPGLAKIGVTRQVLTNKIKLQQDFSSNISLLNEEIGKLKRSQGDTVYLHRIAQTLANLKVPEYVHSNELVTVAKSYAVIGNQEQSLAIIQKLSAPSAAENNHITALKDSIEQHTYQKQFVNQAQTSRISLTKTMQNKITLKHVIIR